MSERAILNSVPDEKVCSMCEYPRTGGSLGHGILLMGRRQSTFPMGCFVGPDWGCLMVTYSLLIAPSIFIIIHISLNYHWAVTFVSILIPLFSVTSLTFAACSDPGIIPKGELVDEEEGGGAEASNGQRMSKCSICNVYRPPGAKHCYDCDACVLELDHHCPWTGKCIGKNNIKYFKLFLGSLSTLIFYSIALLVFHYLQLQQFMKQPADGGGG